MASLDSKVGWLQGPIGILGFLAWMASFKASLWTRDHGWLGAADSFAGYALGFAAAFAGWVAYQLYKGRWERVVDPHPVWKWFSIVILVGVLLFGVVSEVAALFGETSWQFNLSFWIGGLVMAGCVGPLVDRLDGF